MSALGDKDARLHVLAFLSRIKEQWLLQSFLSFLVDHFPNNGHKQPIAHGFKKRIEKREVEGNGEVILFFFRKSFQRLVLGIV